MAHGAEPSTTWLELLDEPSHHLPQDPGFTVSPSIGRFLQELSWLEERVMSAAKMAGAPCSLQAKAWAHNVWIWGI